MTLPPYFWFWYIWSNDLQGVTYYIASKFTPSLPGNILVDFDYWDKNLFPLLPLLSFPPLLFPPINSFSPLLSFLSIPSSCPPILLEVGSLHPARGSGGAVEYKVLKEYKIPEKIKPEVTIKTDTGILDLGIIKWSNQWSFGTDFEGTWWVRWSLLGNWFYVFKLL